MRRIWILALMGFNVGTLSVRAETIEFPEMVRDLNSMQNRMVAGDETARTNVARQFDLMEKTIMNMEPETWVEEKNVRAAAIYLLCGGAPNSLREIFDAKFVSDELSPLLEASLRYAEGEDQAAAKLTEFDARQLPAMLGGHLALVQGGAVVGIDNVRAVTLLDLARLLMPASLVEEAALRREIIAIDPERDSDKISALAKRYIAKYAASPYARNFWTELRAIIFGPTIKADPALFNKFEAAVDKASAEDRLDIYLAFSRRALLDGHLDEATTKLDKAERAVENVQSRKRIETYRAIIKSLSTAEAGNSSRLPDIDTNSLEPQDSEVVKIINGVLTRLEKPFDSKRGPNGTDPSDTYARANDDPPIITSARSALEKSDELLRRRVGR